MEGDRKGGRRRGGSGREYCGLADMLGRGEVKERGEREGERKRKGEGREERRRGGKGGGKMGGAEREEMGSTLSINCKVYAVKRTTIFGT